MNGPEIAQDASKRRRLTLWLWPLGWGAVGVNLFFASLVLSWLNLPVVSPWWAAVVAMPLGLPVAWAFAGHFLRLAARADAAPPVFAEKDQRPSPK